MIIVYILLLVLFLCALYFTLGQKIPAKIDEVAEDLSHLHKIEEKVVEHNVEKQ